MKKNLILAMTMAASIGLAACENVRTDISKGLAGMQQDFSFPAQSSSPAPAPVAETEMAQTPAALPPSPVEESAATVSPDCPNVRIVSDLDQVHQFTHAGKPAPQENISSIWMRNVRDQCTMIDGNIAIDITMAFEGSIGPKGKLHATDNPGFSYPYFVAITSNEGGIIAKEVFAITLNYDQDEKTRTKIEEVRQVIPADGRDYKNYKILIGFQLNDQELAFNRMQTAAQIEPAAGAP